MSKEGFRISTCPTCGSSAIRKTRGNWVGTYKGEPYRVQALEYYSCPNCEEKIYAPEAMRQIQQASPAFSTSPARRPARITPNQAARADA
jgi:YgiT-type zinc finger domain-containing protein